jgi:thiaminase/transcriptional activator TenA
MVATDETATRLAGSEREAMRRRFVTTSRYEWMFWEMGHWREFWPVDA